MSALGPQITYDDSRPGSPAHRYRSISDISRGVALTYFPESSGDKVSFIEMRCLRTRILSVATAQGTGLGTDADLATRHANDRIDYDRQYFVDRRVRFSKRDTRFFVPHARQARVSRAREILAIFLFLSLAGGVSRRSSNATFNQRQRSLTVRLNT